MDGTAGCSFTIIFNTSLEIEEKKREQGNSLPVQWLRLGDFTAMGPGSIPSRVNKILQAVRHGQTKKNTDYYKNNEHHSSN